MVALRRGHLWFARGIQWIVIGAVIVGAWAAIAAVVGAQADVVPEPWTVAINIGNSWGVYARALAVTAKEALWGFMVGNAVAITLGALSVMSRRLSTAVQQFGVLSYCLPIVAVGPILIIVMNGDLPEEVLAGIAVVFTTMVLTAEGLNDIPVALRELADVYGASPGRFFLSVRARFALPYLFRGLRIAAPAAILGAIIGQFLGAGSGIGVVMVQAEQGLQVPRTWAAAILSTAMAGLAYGVLGLAERLLVPWARESRL